ncbi:MAG: hypothetical protein IRZ06_04255 [Nevskia sp.]|nr:hypothetical protein [Nevskia sp.]
MSLRVPKNVLEAALGGAPVKRYREFALVVFEGEGAICVPNDVWLPAASWAASRTPSGNRLRDRGLLLQRLDVLVTRRGTAIVTTTGAHRRLARLREAMKAEGLDLKEWNFPPQEVLDQALNPEAARPERESKPDEPEDG